MSIINPVLRAARFAKKAHAGQTRRYNGEPFVNHPARVAARVALLEGATEAMVVAAWLHDVIEDTDVPSSDIMYEFGHGVLELVQELTNPSKDSSEPRRVRKQMDLDHLMDVSNEAKRIKLVDRLENLQDMAGAESDFPALYARESRALLEAIGHADEELRVALTRVLLEMEGHS